MIKFCLEPSTDTNIWDAAEDALSLSYQVQGAEVLLLYKGVLLRVKHKRDSVADIFADYELKAPAVREAVGRGQGVGGRA